MQGHTDRNTINDRKPLTKGTRDMLADVCRKRFVYQHELDTADKNRMRALMDRGYVEPCSSGMIQAWKPTNAGYELIRGKPWSPPVYRRIDAGSADAVPNGGHDPQGS